MADTTTQNTEKRFNRWVYILGGVLILPLAAHLAIAISTSVQIADGEREQLTGCTVDNVVEHHTRMGEYTVLHTSCGELRDDANRTWQVGEVLDFSVLRCDFPLCIGGDRI
ncbi:hypothetical protein [Microbacterium sp. 77mftsu3.1]|uniref:hypothetical protein n=1 Tax=Microbacterium sp. 77mftsu3.1 TaxID=1761802 RepID=UPI000374100B|nr:hypothetical protein [Microbacterium sp. 77mftsu3.1]SDH47699.1 hypothetical protein SAMN04488590_3390 [Microbacterium sp. 77mftsu3.1]